MEALQLQQPLDVLLGEEFLTDSDLTKESRIACLAIDDLVDLVEGEQAEPQADRSKGISSPGPLAGTRDLAVGKVEILSQEGRKFRDVSVGFHAALIDRSRR